MLVSFFTALFFGDWMTAESDAKDMVYDVLTPYYWVDSQSAAWLAVLDHLKAWTID